MSERYRAAMVLEYCSRLVRVYIERGDEAAAQRHLARVRDACAVLEPPASGSADALRAAMASSLSVRPVDYVRRRDVAKARLAHREPGICGCVPGEACMNCEYEGGGR